jgi:hypothetical protein
MNLYRLFESLNQPTTNVSFNTIKVKGGHRVGINEDGYPVILLSIPLDPSSIYLKNQRFKYIEVIKEVSCCVSSPETFGNTLEVYTVIIFFSSDPSLIECFFKIVNSFMVSIENLTLKDIQTAIIKIIEVFKSLTEECKKSILGLWGELFVISESFNPKVLINAWHNYPEQLFDFDNGCEKIEVKTTVLQNRIHSFSSSQLNPPNNVNVIIASILTYPDSEGITCLELIDRFRELIDDERLLLKLDSIIVQTLGNKLNEARISRFNLKFAQKSIQFYNYSLIPRIKENFIPEGVNRVRYSSDLSAVPIYAFIDSDGQLFKALRVQ